MPNLDLTTIIERLAPITFGPADETPVDPDRRYLVAPGNGVDWEIGRRTAEGWFNTEGLPLAAEPRIAAALPTAPFRHLDLDRLADELVEHIGARELDRAASVIDELADAVRALRDRHPG